MSEGTWNPMAQQYDPKTLTLAAFLLARIAEDEAAVREIENGFDYDPRARESRSADDRGLEWINPSDHWSDTYRLAVPGERVLAECEAKRRIVELHGHPDGECWEMHHGTYPTDWPAEASWGDAGAPWSHPSLEAQTGPCPTLCALAAPYADHPDYRDEWRP